MAEYKSWNNALVQYFQKGMPHGSPLYLSIDDDILEGIGQQLFATDPLNSSWSRDFQVAVQRQLIRSGRIELEGIEGYDAQTGYPNCVAFLALCVLAAARMAEDEDVSDTNYFRRLREVLNLDGSSDPRLKGNLARPKGMKAGAEEPLWQRWNQWLLERGFIPSAKPGLSRRDKFIRYPISQCLLRQGDRDRLEKHCASKKWIKAWDAQTLFSRLRADTQQFPEYLRNLIKHSGDRYEVLADAVYEVHQQWLEAGCPAPTPQSSRAQRQPSPNLSAGLYRLEEEGEIEYLLYPKQQPRQFLEKIQVQYQGELHELESDRPGWYLPLGEPLSPEDLSGGVRCEILQPEALRALQLPARDFWLLVPDPEEPDVGIYGSWRSPELGIPFILLCKKSLLNDLQRLRDERLVEWSEQLEPFWGQETDWLELHRFMVLSQAWQGVFIENWELKDALQPKVSLSIHPSGGLRVPQQKGWLHGYPPQITVFGFTPTVQLELLRLPHDEGIAVWEALKTNQPHSIGTLDPGSYLLRATHGRKVAECFVRIVPWDELELQPTPQRETEPLGSEDYLCGATFV